MNEVDQVVGSRIRAQRRSLAKTQSDLAKAIGVASQQIQKYELGINRVSASRLWKIAEVLEVPISFFFDGLHKNGQDETEARLPRAMNDPDALEVVRLFAGLPQDKRRAFASLLREMR